ncbi:MAG: recombination protein O N-terminal domain-containing protein [Patescibacteria group bacterium]
MATILTTHDAIVLAARPHKENDLRISWYSRTHGLCDAIAIGARKSTSKQRMRLEPGTVTFLTTAQGKQFDRVISSEPVRVPTALRETLLGMQGLQFLCAIILETQRQADMQHGLWDVLLVARMYLEEQTLTPGLVDAWSQQLGRRILEAAGFAAPAHHVRTTMETYFERPLRAWAILEL